MKHRNLRIAWSLVCGAGCMLLAALWIRSYWWVDYVHIPNSKTQVVSIRGGLAFQRSEFVDTDHWSWEPERIADFRPRFRDSGEFLFPWVNDQLVILPIWLIMLAPASLAAVPWLRIRFRLRTLLVATTLVGVVLGIIVWMSRTG